MLNHAKSCKNHQEIRHRYQPEWAGSHGVPQFQTGQYNIAITPGRCSDFIGRIAVGQQAHVMGRLTNNTHHDRSHRYYDQATQNEIGVTPAVIFNHQAGTRHQYQTTQANPRQC